MRRAIALVFVVTAGCSASSSSSSSSSSGTHATASAGGTHASSTSGSPGSTSATSTGGTTQGVTGSSTSSSSSATNGTSSTGGATTNGSGGSSGTPLACPTATDTLPDGVSTVELSASAEVHAGSCMPQQVHRASFTLHVAIREQLDVAVGGDAAVVITSPGCNDFYLCASAAQANLDPGDYVVSIESAGADPVPMEVRHVLEPEANVACASAVDLATPDAEVHADYPNGFTPPQPHPSCVVPDAGTYFFDMQGAWYRLHVAEPSHFTAELRTDPFADLVLVGAGCTDVPLACAPWQYDPSSFSSDLYTQMSRDLDPGDYDLAVVADADSFSRGGSYGLYTHLEPLARDGGIVEVPPELACALDGPELPSGVFTVDFDGGASAGFNYCDGDGGFRRTFRLPASPNPLAVRLSGEPGTVVQLVEPGCTDDIGFGSVCSGDFYGDAGSLTGGLSPIAVLESKTGATAQFEADYYEIPAGNLDCDTAAVIGEGSHEFQSWTGQPFTQPLPSESDCRTDGGFHYPGASGAYFRVDVSTTETLTADLYTNTYGDLILLPASSCGAAPITCAPGDSSCFFSCSYSTHFEHTLAPGSYYLVVTDQDPTRDHYGLFTTLAP